VTVPVTPRSPALYFFTTHTVQTHVTDGKVAESGPSESYKV